jgi:hypothetical protein
MFRKPVTLVLIFGCSIVSCLSGATVTSSPQPSRVGPTLSTAAHTTLPEDAGSPSQPARLAAAATTYYVRPDGGSSSQCNGRSDAPYTGDSQDCAWDHPFRALPPGATPRISGGDTLVIASGSYMMGYGAPGGDACESSARWDCHMPPIPSGPDAAQPTRILGAGWDATCPSPPELWGTERPWFILNLTGSNYVELACLEITDHAGCVEDHSGGLACERDNAPFGSWAAVGLYAQDAREVHLRDLDIHGLAVAGVHAGRLTDWRVERVRLAGNGWAGWDGDIEGTDANAGTLTFQHWTVEWNGCAETFPGGEPVGCWAQTAGGYGDGVGTGETGGRWIIEDSAFVHNTSDGLDLLYTRLEDSDITIRRTLAAGNAGDQIKTSGPTYLENVVTVSNCGFFEGKPFTFNVDNCRAGGSALAFTLRSGDQIAVVNGTITGEGDCLIIAEGEDGTVVLRNDILLGNPEFGQAGDTTCMAWYGTPGDPYSIDYSIIDGVKEDLSVCPDHSYCDVDPGLTSSDILGFDAHLRQDSPAIDHGTAAGAPGVDFEGHPRDAQPDIGAYEWWAAAAWVYLPAVRKN